MTYTLTSKPEGASTFITLSPNIINDDGIVTVPLIHRGNYTITQVDLECNPEKCEACLPVYTITTTREYHDNVSLSLSLLLIVT